jgi:hypothetical protein
MGWWQTTVLSQRDIGTRNAEVTLKNSSCINFCGFCTFAHTMWKGTKLHRGFTSDVQSHIKIHKL